MSSNRRTGLKPASSQPLTSLKNTPTHNNKSNTSPKPNTTHKISRVSDGSRIPTTGQAKPNDIHHTTRISDKNGTSGEKTDNTALVNEAVNKNIVQSQTTISNQKLNYATATAKENNPQRDQAIIFNSIEGIPQID